MPRPTVTFQIAYARYSELADDVSQQMARGGLLIKIDDVRDLTFDMPATLELVLPDETALRGDARVLQVLAGFGVAISVDAALIEQARRAARGVDRPGAPAARHRRLDGAAAAPPPAPAPVEATPEPAAASAGAGKADALTRAEKIQQALHGTRDERNAILRDRDRTLHSFVLKNPQLNADDVVAIAKNAQMTPELLKQVGERKDWLQRPAIALALVRNPKTPPELAIRALDHIPADALRQIAKGPGVLPHVSQAARKKLLG